MTHTDPSGSPETNADRRDVRDRLEPRRLVHTYASTPDRRNPKVFASLFDDDGELILNSPAADSASGETDRLAHETYAMPRTPERACAPSTTAAPTGVRQEPAHRPLTPAAPAPQGTQHRSTLCSRADRGNV
ncbi:hypothetical protein [Streptomyces sp. B21-083]|uniref:hypothetical protein n=1 Tax=Streptomyces sp. B21-083 TaxID=3039410 RepID=UPI002FF26249